MATCHLPSGFYKKSFLLFYIIHFGLINTSITNDHSSNLDFRQIFHKRARYVKLQMMCVECTSVKAEMAPYHIRSELEVGSIVTPKN